MDPVAALREIAYYKDRAREDSRRVMAYRKAADVVESLTDAQRSQHGRANSWQALPGIGPKTARVIAQAWSGREPDVLTELRSNATDLGRGGRLVFIGAGTSGRLGVIEAAECPPTFGTDPDMILGIIAGGRKAVWKSAEGAEDSSEEARKKLERINLKKKDVLVGIAASGGTPFVEGALDYARKKGSGRILVTCNPVETTVPDVVISVLVGPEVITGSTRMKAGTATKMVLNMLTTASMVRLGKTYGNLMVDVRPG